MRGVDKKVETAEACGQAAQSGPEGMGPERPGPGGSHVRRVALWHRRAGGRGPAGRGGPMEERGPVMWRSVAAAAPRTEAAPGQWAKGGPEGRGQEGPAPAALTWEEPPGGTGRRAHRARRGGAALWKEQGW